MSQLGGNLGVEIIYTWPSFFVLSPSIAVSEKIRKFSSQICFPLFPRFRILDAFSSLATSSFITDPLFSPLISTVNSMWVHSKEDKSQELTFRNRVAKMWPGNSVTSRILFLFGKMGVTASLTDDTRICTSGTEVLKSHAKLFLDSWRLVPEN